MQRRSAYYLGIYHARRGRRLVYKIPEGVTVRKTKAKESKEDKLNKGLHEELSFYGNGSQIVLPPSIHPNGGVYEWIKGKSPDDIECAMAPQWLIEEMQEKKVEKTPKKRVQKKVEQDNDNKDSEMILNQLASHCQYFKAAWQEQKKDGIDEEAWFLWISLFVAAGHHGSAYTFSRASGKHDDRSDSRLEGLMADQKVKIIFPVRCTTLGCNQEQIEKCFGKLNINNDEEITNSPASFIASSIYEKYFDGKKFRAKWLADEILTDYPIIYVSEDFYKYDNGVYKPGAQNIIEKEAVKRLDKEYTSGRIREVAYYIQKNCAHEDQDINKDTHLINLKNGLYDIYTGELLEHDPKYLITVRINSSYNIDAKCTSFRTFIDQTVTPENHKVIQEIFGYCLIPETKAQKAFLFYGPGSTGKSTMLNVLIYMLGKQNVSSVPLQNLSDKFRTADLFGRLANIVADLPFNRLDDAGLFKEIVTGDMIHAERKFCDPFTFNPFTRLIFSCNNLPPSNDRTTGFYRRLLIIPFNNVVPDSQRDVELERKLCNEVDGILAWSLEGLRRLIENKFYFSETESTNELLNIYKKENSSVLSFINDECEIDPHSRVGKSLLYGVFQKYCDENRLPKYSNIKFNDEIEKNFPNIVEKREGKDRKRVWTGIKLITDTIILN